MTKRERAYIGLGGNVGDTRRTLSNAVRALAALPGAELAAVSPLYRTRPVGVHAQPDFLNAVVALDVPAGPDPETGALALLGALKELEHALGRQPRQRWGPREIDLDLLLFGNHRVSTQRPDGRWLEVPHPQMHERLFVLAPLADIAPDVRPPGWGQTAAAAAERRAGAEPAGALMGAEQWHRNTLSWR